MEANKVLINGVFNGSRQLDIPFYQRSYVWDKPEWERFLSDMEFVSASKTPYFLGSLIVKHGAPHAMGDAVTDSCTVIDGQQRLTTLMIFLKALCLKIGRDDLFQRDFMLEDGSMALLHGKNDISAFSTVINKTDLDPLEDNGSQISKAFDFFAESIDPESLDRGEIKRNVQFVSIELTEDEDEQQIFDTINSLGVRLTTAELLKNYFFSRDDQEAYELNWEDVFETPAENRDYWDTEVTTGRLKRTLIDLFFDAYLQILIQDKKLGVSAEDKIAYARVDSLFHSYKHFISKYLKGDKRSLLAEMRVYAKLFQETFDPNCCEAAMPSDFGKERLNVLIFGLNNTTMIPYVLYLAKKVSEDEFDEMCQMLEAFMMRRLVTKASTKNNNRFFSSLILNSVDSLDGLKRALTSSATSTSYPTDEELKEGFQTSSLYNLQSKGVIYFIESSMRSSLDSTLLLGFDQYSLEHLMPKKWRNKWKGVKGAEAEQARDKALRTLGNLAMLPQKLNASVRDASWKAKKRGVNGKPGLIKCASGLQTLTDALQKDEWNEDEISARGEWLAEQALRIWTI